MRGLKQRVSMRTFSTPRRYGWTAGIGCVSPTATEARQVVSEKFPHFWRGPIDYRYSGGGRCRRGLRGVPAQRARKLPQAGPLATSLVPADGRASIPASRAPCGTRGSCFLFSNLQEDLSEEKVMYRSKLS